MPLSWRHRHRRSDEVQWRRFVLQHSENRLQGSGSDEKAAHALLSTCSACKCG